MSTYTQQNHAPPLAHSNSFFGAIKNIVAAPFAWFAGSEDEFEGAKGKRRRLPVIPEDTQMEDGTLPNKAKRMRVGSPDRDTHPYLDPPKSVFTHARRASDHSVSASVRDGTRPPRKALHLPSSSNQLPRNRRTVSPLPSSSHLKSEGVTRTMSLDPPSRSGFSSRIQATPTIPDLQSESNHAGGSASTIRDSPMSPRRLRVRSSLTPQPSGIGFGPVVPPRRERGLDEPPPLTTLMSNPIFVKPPPGIQKQGAAEPQKNLTLGSLMDSQRTARAPVRQSSILFGTGSMTDVSAPGRPWPVNKAEIALHELEVYKTPLLPTRLKGATAVPDMFLHKERKHITLMTDDRPVKPRLGTKSKGKEKGKGKRRDRETVNVTKPYAGEGGMKKWLARRKEEEEEEKEKELAEAMEDERAEEKRHEEAEAEKRRHEEELKVPPPPPEAPAFGPRLCREGPLSSSLRVGRARVGRNHLEHPVSRRAKFSAAFEDEDEDMEESRLAERKVLEEAAKKVPAFELPTNFTFPEVSTITHDLTNAKEPPISSLPFSLTKPASAPTPVPVPPVAETAKLTATPVPVAPAPIPPKISLVPPTPETVKVASEAPSLSVPVVSSSNSVPAPSGIPNFFANSSVFAKPVATVPSSSLLTVPAAGQLKPADVPEPKVTGAPSLFGGPSRPISLFPTAGSATSSFTLGAAPTLPKESEKPATTTPSLAPPFTFGAPPKSAEATSVSTSNPPVEQPSAAEPAKPAAPSTPAPFAFGAPPPASLPAAAAIPTLATPAATAEPPKSVFTFNQAAPSAVSASTPAPPTAAPTAETPKPLFGTPPPAAPFSFGQRPSVAPTEGKPATSPFSFATSTSESEKKPAAGFTFGSSTAPTTAPTASTSAPAPFSFGPTPSGTTAADVSSKPFSFGSTAPARSATPPKTMQEVTMDESPVREMVLNGSGKAPERPTLNFSFNTPSGSALFAQSPATTSSPFSFGAPGTAVNPFGKEEKKDTKPGVSFGGFGQGSTGFSFGQNKPPESPATTAPPFQFAQPSPTVAPVSPFAFNAAPASAAPFGQPSAVSAPSSPSFNRPTSFAFGTPTTTQPTSSPFAFGAASQPASPATGSTTLPTGATGSAPFTFGAGAAPAAQPFGASGAAPGGASLFTMGSAPPPEGAGGRRIKGLPRRGVRR